jgi:hypothetical protein
LSAKECSFFIPRIAAEDIFEANPDPVNEHIFEFEVVKESGHSVIWLMNNIDLDLTAFIEQIQKLKCSYEGFPIFSLAAIDVPPSVNIDKLNE